MYVPIRCHVPYMFRKMYGTHAEHPVQKWNLQEHTRKQIEHVKNMERTQGALKNMERTHVSICSEQKCSTSCSLYVAICSGKNVPYVFQNIAATRRNIKWNTRILWNTKEHVRNKMFQNVPICSICSRKQQEHTWNTCGTCGTHRNS